MKTSIRYFIQSCERNNAIMAGLIVSIGALSVNACIIIYLIYRGLL